MTSFLHHLGHSIRTTPRAIWVLIGGMFINRLGSFVYPFLALYLASRGYTLGEISAVFGALAIGQLFSPFVGGYLADAIGRRNTIVISLVGGAVSILGLYASDRLAGLCLAAALHSFLSHLYNPAASALMSDLVPEDRRQMSFSLLRISINAGFTLGPALGGVLFGIDPALIFLGDAATTLVFAFFAVRHLPHGLRTVEGSVASPRVIARSWLAAAADVWANKPFLRLYCGLLLMAFALMQTITVLSLHATDRGLKPSLYGLVMGFNGLMIISCEMPLSHVTRRLRPHRVLACGFAVIGLGCAAFALAHSFSGFIAAMALFTVGEMLTLPVVSTYASTLAPAAFRGRYFGILGTAWALASLAGSAGPFLYGHLGAAWWPVAGAIAMLGAFGMLGEKRANRVVRVAPNPPPCTLSPPATIPPPAASKSANPTF